MDSFKAHLIVPVWKYFDKQPPPANIKFLTGANSTTVSNSLHDILSTSEFERNAYCLKNSFKSPLTIPIHRTYNTNQITFNIDMIFKVGIVGQVEVVI